MNKHQATNKSADGRVPLVAEHDASMRMTARVQAQEVCVMRYEHPAVPRREGELLLVSRTSEPFLGGGGDVDAAEPQAERYGARNALIETSSSGPTSPASSPTHLFGASRCVAPSRCCHDE